MEGKREACWRKCCGYRQTYKEKKLYYKENLLRSFVGRMQHGRKTTMDTEKAGAP
jgi:hypothetical protein